MDAASRFIAKLLACLTLDRGIGWSKWGSVAAIASNGAALELRNLRVNPENGSWALSEPTVTPNFSSAMDGGPLKHLSWSPTGSDLAVIDAAGRITILAIFSSVNKPSLSRACQPDPADDLHGIVGCYWLNIAPYPPSRPVRLEALNKTTAKLIIWVDNSARSKSQRWTWVQVRSIASPSLRTLPSQSIEVCICMSYYERSSAASMATEYGKVV